MISVVIPSYNSALTIEGCLESLARQTYTGEYEVILADSSSDGTSRIVRDQYPEVHLISFPERMDPGKARNAGILKARGEIIALIDSDCVAAPDWLEKIDAAHRLPYEAVGGVILNGNGPGDLVGLAGYISEFREFLPEQPRREVTHVPTCNISYKRSVFTEYGLFDGRYYPQEDLVFNRGFCANGRRILLDPAIRVHHHHRSSLKGFLRHQGRIGEVTARVLKVLHMEGSFVARHSLVGYLAVPLLPAVKFARTLAVFMKLQRRTVADHPLAVCIFALGLACWAIGFARGVHQPKRVRMTRKETL